MLSMFDHLMFVIHCFDCYFVDYFVDGYYDFVALSVHYGHYGRYVHLLIVTIVRMKAVVIVRVLCDSIVFALFLSREAVDVGY